MARKRIIINIANAKLEMLFITDATLDEINFAFKHGGPVPKSTRYYNDDTLIPNRPLDTTILIPKAIAENCIIEIDEVEAHEPVAYDDQHPKEEEANLTIPMKITTEA